MKEITLSFAIFLHSSFPLFTKRPLQLPAHFQRIPVHVKYLLYNRPVERDIGAKFYTFSGQQNSFYSPFHLDSYDTLLSYLFSHSSRVKPINVFEAESKKEQGKDGN
jgi:hypothetical protein